jgi:hypothetical protein
MTGKKITLSSAMRARDVSRPPEDPSDATGSAPYGEDRPLRPEEPRGAASASDPGDATGSAPVDGQREALPAAGGAPYGGDRSLRREDPRGAASASDPGDAAAGSPAYGGDSSLRREKSRGAASASERAQARILGGAGMVAAGTPEAKREGSSQAQPDGAAPSPSGQGVWGIGVYPPGNSVYPPGKKRRTRKRRAG